MSSVALKDSCPCTSGKTYADCCQPLLAGKEKAKTAEELLRSRYSAFAVGNIDYIVNTHHPKTRGEIDRKEIETWSKSSQWEGLEVLQKEAGEAKDEQGTIIFHAKYVADGKKQDHYEKSFFEREKGEWMFLDAQGIQTGPYVRADPKVGRKRYSDRPWYLPAVCLLAFIDLFVMFIPTEGMIVTTTLMRPKRWWITALFVTLASSCGAMTLAWLGTRYGEPFTLWLLGDHVFESAMWIRMNGWIQDYGFWGLWFIAIGPLPQQPAILICTLGHMTPFEISTAVFLGRAPKYFLFSYLATKGPQWFKHAFGDEAINLEFTWANLKTWLKKS